MKSVELARIILDHGSDVDVRDGEGYTPLFLAPELGAPLEVVKLLVERGADIHVDDDNPLWSAIWHVSYGFGGMPIVRYFVKQGSRPRGLTHAAEAGKLRIVLVLLELVANVNEVDEEGHTPLDYATGAAHTFMRDQIKNKKSQDHAGVEKFLRSRGAKLSGGSSKAARPPPRLASRRFATAPFRCASSQLDAVRIWRADRFQKPQSDSIMAISPGVLATYGARFTAVHLRLAGSKRKQLPHALDLLAESGLTSRSPKNELCSYSYLA